MRLKLCLITGILLSSRGMVWAVLGNVTDVKFYHYALYFNNTVSVFGQNLPTPGIIIQPAKR
jgi:hypothetical protein